MDDFKGIIRKQDSLIKELKQIKAKVSKFKSKSTKNSKIMKIDAKEFTNNPNFSSYLERRNHLLTLKKSTIPKRCNSKVKKRKQAETMIKFESFVKKLKKKSKVSEPILSSSVSTQKDNSFDEFKGGIGDNKLENELEDINEDDERWLSSKLTFRRHVDDDFRKSENSMKFELKASDYKVIDTKKTKYKFK